MLAINSHIPMIPPRAVCRSPPYSSTPCYDSTVTSSNFYTFLARQQHRFSTQNTPPIITISTGMPIGTIYPITYSSLYYWGRGYFTDCSRSNMNCLGQANEVVPLPCHPESQLKLPSYLTMSPTNTSPVRFSSFSYPALAPTSPCNWRASCSSSTLTHSPSFFDTFRLVILAVWHPSTDTPRRPPRWLNCNYGRNTLSKAFSMRTPLATKPLLLLLESGGRSMPASLPNCEITLGPSSSRKTSPLAIPLGQGAQSRAVQVVMTDQNLPAAQAQSSNVPVAGYTTQSIVPVLNRISPNCLLSPPSRYSMAPIALRMSQSAVWLLAAWVSVPQLQEISAPCPPLCSATVRSKRYLRNSMSRIWVAVVRQQSVFPSTGKSLFTSNPPGDVARIPFAKPDGFATGKQTMRSALRCLQAQSRVRGPMNSSPCIPETSKTVRGGVLFGGGVGWVASKQQKWHLVPQHCSSSMAMWETLKTCSLGTIDNHCPMYSRQSLYLLNPSHPTITNTNTTQIHLTKVIIINQTIPSYSPFDIKSHPIFIHQLCAPLPLVAHYHPHSPPIHSLDV